MNQLPALRRGFDFTHDGHFPPLSASVAGSSPLPEETRKSNASAPNRFEEFYNARTTGRGIWKWNHYFEIYQRYFQKFVGRDVNILEIGVYSGGSLDMWRDYFGEHCRIFGVDIFPGCATYENEFTKILIGDQASPDFWASTVKQIPMMDIVIDDGGHETQQQIVTLERMFPHIRPGGVYLCEDITGTHNDFAAYLSGYIKNLNHFNLVRRGSNMIADPNDFQRAVHAIHFHPFVTVIEKALEPVSTFASDKHGTQWQPILKT